MTIWWLDTDYRPGKHKPLQSAIATPITRFGSNSANLPVDTKALESAGETFHKAATPLL